MRHQTFLLAVCIVALLALGCSFPDYAIVGPTLSGGAGGVASPPQAGSTSGGLAGSAGAAAGAGTGDGGRGGAPSDGVAGSSGGAAGAGLAGESGEGGQAPALPKKCADYTSLPTDAACFDDATHAYLFRSETKPFTIAAAQCGFYEMHLASIESATEDAFINRSAAKITEPSQFGYFWIGGSTIGSHGTWRWPNGDVFWTGDANGHQNGDAYFNWRTASPVNTTSDSCAFSDDAGWQDGACAQNRPYVCEAD